MNVSPAKHQQLAVLCNFVVPIVVTDKIKMHGNVQKHSAYNVLLAEVLFSNNAGSET